MLLKPVAGNKMAWGKKNWKAGLKLNLCGWNLHS